jgi:hypothetical protein
MAQTYDEIFGGDDARVSNVLTIVVKTYPEAARDYCERVALATDPSPHRSTHKTLTPTVSTTVFDTVVERTSADS